MKRTAVLLLFLLPRILAAQSHTALRVDEAASRVRLAQDHSVVSLAVVNPNAHPVSAQVRVEALDPQDKVCATAETLARLRPGASTVSLPVSLSVSTEEEQVQVFWYRLRYQVVAKGVAPATGILALAEIAPEVFDLRVATPGFITPGTSFPVRVRAQHPVTQRPVRGVSISAKVKFDDNREPLRAQGVTGADGYARLDFRVPAELPGDDASLTVSGKLGEFLREAEDSLQLAKFGAFYVTTDKPLYQPGQTLHLRSLVLDATRHAVANEPLKLKISDPDHTLVYQTMISTSRYGIAQADWPIPENLKLGRYSVMLQSDSGRFLQGPQGGTWVNISRYELPNFTVHAKPDRAYYLPGQNASVEVSAEYLFGKPVTRGHVRVVREADRTWNFQEQRWETTEEEKYEGDTDAKGVFTAHLDLAAHHADIKDPDDRRFRDLTYAAYFTDPSTGRTEQRRFQVRVTRDPIHVYLIEPSGRNEFGGVPLDFYVSAFYADGAPCECEVTIREGTGRDRVGPVLRIVRTNRYGVAKVFGLQLTPDPDRDPGDSVDILLRARDAKGSNGQQSERIYRHSDEKSAIHVDSDRTLYRPGESATVTFFCSERDRTLIFEVWSGQKLLLSQMVKLHGNKGFTVLPFREEFQGELRLLAYSLGGDDSFSSRSLRGVRTILYPHDTTLKVNVKLNQAAYKPGEEAQASLQVDAPGGTPVQAVLGAVVFDKAVEERFRTDQEFGRREGYGFDYAFWDYFGYDDSLGTVNRAGLEQLDVTRPFADDLDLAAEVLLNQWGYAPFSVFGSEGYLPAASRIFQAGMQRRLKPVQEALDRLYRARMEYPHDEASLRRLLAGEGIRFDGLLDPWGNPYHANFSFSRDEEVMDVITAGPDKVVGTADDFTVLTFRRPYFQPTGLALNRALQEYHDRTGGYVRDAATLKSELLRQGISFDALRDPWGQPYALDFGIANTRFYAQVTSSGPDRKLEPQRSGDDVTMWTAYSDYFAEMQVAIDAALAQHFQKTGQFPSGEAGLLAVLREAAISPDKLRDGWGRPLYMTFNDVPHFADRVVMSYQEYLGRSLPKMSVLAVTQKVSYIHLRSAGEDGKPGTSDDFEMATFSRVVAEQTAQQPAPQFTPHAPPLAQGTGGIEGTITDPAGAVITGAQVTATNSGTQVSTNTTTDGNGHFEIRDLPAGDYRVQVYAAGFRLATITQVPIRVEQMVELSLSLRVGASTETVTVEASVPMVQTTSASLAEAKAPAGTTAPIATPRLRQFFPETLFWQPEVVTDTQGRTRLRFKLADNITTWKMSLVASTLDGQIGVADKEFRAFQPFFVELDPPQVLTQGDEIELPVVLRNYLEKAQTLDVSMQKEAWFTLLSAERQQTSVAAGDSARATFRFRAVASIRKGKQQVTAANRSTGDRVEKPVRVHPDGQEVAQSVAQLFDNRTTLALDLPPYLMAGTIRAQIKLYPNLTDHVLESVEAILERPYGCGEQTISSTYPNVLLLQLYKRLGKPQDALYLRSLRYTSMGYARLLSYQDESGGFTYWGHGEPDLALTAYALRFLADASEFVSVDSGVMDNARQWLIEQHDKDGRWGKSDQTTAYVAWVLASSPAPAASSSDTTEQQAALKIAAAQHAVLTRALDLLSSRLDTVPDPYLLSDFALAASREGRSQDAARARQFLARFRHEEAGTSYWALETNTPFYGWGRAGRIETTALAVQVLVQAGERDLARSGLLFLLRNQDRYGVWYSTQATINVLQALLLLAADGQGDQPGGGSVDILVNGSKVASVTLPGSRELSNPISVDLSAALGPGANRVEVMRAGSAQPISAQLVAAYYIPWEKSDAGVGTTVRTGDSDALRVSVAYDKTDGVAGQSVRCRVHAERIGHRGYGMLLAEIGLPPGADVDRASLEHAVQNAGWAVDRYEVLPDRVVLYLWPPAGGTDFEFSFRPRYAENALTAPSDVYDYYNPEASAVVAPTRFVVRDSADQTEARGR